MHARHPTNQAFKTERLMPGAELADEATLGDSNEDELLISLPREADSPQFCEPSSNIDSRSTSARPVWLDGASAAAIQAAPPAVPRPSPRPKRGMEASPFAGLVSKKPFRRRAFNPVQDPISEEPEQSTASAAQPLPEAELSNDTINTHNLISRLPSVPTVVTTNAFMQVSISPQIWRAREEAGRLMLNVGLQGIQLDGQQDLQLYLWSTLNPRIVTTGIPRPASAGDLAERTSSSVLSFDGEADEGSSHSKSRAGQSPVAATGAKPCDGLMLDEVFLVRRDPQRRIPDEVFHTRGPFEGSRVLTLPDWPGDIWRFDLCCKVDNRSNEVIWVKSLDKRLQQQAISLPSTVF